MGLRFYGTSLSSALSSVGGGSGPAGVLLSSIGSLESPTEDEGRMVLLGERWKPGLTRSII